MEISLSSVVANPLDCPQPSEAITGIDDFVVQFWGVRGDSAGWRLPETALRRTGSALEFAGAADGFAGRFEFL